MMLVPAWFLYTILTGCGGAACLLAYVSWRVWNDEKAYLRMLRQKDVEIYYLTEAVISQEMPELR